MEHTHNLLKSIYAMDFFTVDTILNVRFYVFFIIRHQTREIIQYARGGV